ncbi:tetratricopeptide repeat protein [Pseudanabaena sp. UWO311]|uniref:tetratricopeptide repeat protein n=1 Tax=Pseudanabaena sp. UWO311 TaxID=2487337 RepID=UPI00115B8965|nr:tetratricopeptide repeat protein [Pseudanabaena sp. UWO311]TYQ25562.1 tetratricopeptide repeat protein [Pseudanabaena sp. UWO311]
MYKNLTSPIAFSLLLLVSLPSTSMLILESKSAAWAQSVATIQDQKSLADNLLKQAKQNLEVSQNLEAFKAYQKALKIYRQVGDLQGEAESLNGMSTAYYNQDALEIGLYRYKPVYFEGFGFTERENHFKQALAIAKKIGNPKLEAEALIGLGRHVDRTSFYDRAIKYYEQALAIAKKIGDLPLEGRVLKYLGVTHSNGSYFQKVLDLYQQSLVIAKKTSDHQLEASVLKELCSLYHKDDSSYIDKLSLSKIEMWQKSINYCQKSLDVFSQIKDVPNTIKLLHFLSSSYEDVISKEQVIKYYQQTLLIAQQTNDRDLQKGTIASLGNTYHELGQYQKAIDFYFQALKFESPVLETAIHSENLGLYYLFKDIARSYGELKQYPLAIDYYTRSLAIAKLYNKNNRDNVKSVSFTEEDVLWSLGDAYYDSKNYQKAIDNYQESLSIYGKIKRDRRSAGAILWNLGNSYFALDNYQQAIASYQESLSIFKEFKNFASQASLLSNLGNSFFAIKQYQKAIDAYQQALTIKKNLDDRQDVPELIQNLLDAKEALMNQKT